MTFTPYLSFNGRCDEAIAFYTRAMGAKVRMLMRFSDSPEPPPPGCLPPGFENKVMHAELRIGDARLMCTDGPGAPEAGFRNVSIAVEVEDEQQVRRMFDALADGGQVTMPPGRTFWSPCFGMLTDRYGLGWMIGMQSQAVDQGSESEVTA
jgi:PhnB protein